MKDSGIEWIGEIPEDWKVVKTKNVYNNCKEIVGDKVDYYERLSLTLNGVLRRSKEDANGLQPAKFEGYQILRENELVFKLIDLENVNTSRVGLSPFTGLVSPAYIVLRNKDASRFGYYYFLSMWHREIFNKLGGDGVRSNLNVKDLLNIPYLIIPQAKQEKIANFLDKKVSEIDHILEKTRETIEEYKKYKQSIITEAVTKGLNPNVEMKDSGIKWIGEIPKHWDAMKLKYMTRKIIDGTHSTPTYTSEGVPFLRVTDISSLRNIYDEVNFDTVARISKEEHEELIKRCYPEKGDLLVSKNGTIGVPKVINWDEPFSIFVSLCLIKLNDKIDVEYLYYYFKSTLIWTEISIGGKTGTITNLHLDKIKEFSIPMGSVDEQEEIVLYMNLKCKEIDSLINQKETLLKDLELYKKSLIYECVTGKREVM